MAEVVQKEGIKETLELTVAFLAIARMMAEQFKDGMQAEDAVEIIKKSLTPEMSKLIVDAYNGVEKVPAEIKDLTLMEVMDLIKIALPQILSIFSNVNKAK
jgi:hypothetical protein